MKEILNKGTDGNTNLLNMPTAKKIPPEKIAKQLEKLEDQVYFKKLKPKDMHKKMVTLACELVCSDQPRRSCIGFS